MAAQFNRPDPVAGVTEAYGVDDEFRASVHRDPLLRSV
jgi:hypothetical protein